MLVHRVAPVMFERSGYHAAVEEEAFRPFAGMTRIRFKGSSRCLLPLNVDEAGGLSAPFRSSPRNSPNVGACARLSTRLQVRGQVGASQQDRSSVYATRCQSFVTSPKLKAWTIC